LLVIERIGDALCNATPTSAVPSVYRLDTAFEKNENMKSAPRVRESDVLPFYAIGCLWVGAAIFSAAGLRDASLGAVIVGVGFAIYGVSAYREPVVFRTPLLAALEHPLTKGPVERGLDLIAIVAIACGLVVLWWG
jgi:hypothetical protein